MTSVAQPPATTAPAFTLAGLSLARPHGGFRLGPIDLRFPTDASVALVGPSGSGKTTLLRLIAGLERPDAGEITWAGERWSEGGRIAVPAAARRIGFVFQDGALWPHLDAIAHVRFVDPRATRDDAARLLARVGLAGLEKRKPGELSGGERQRLALARALAGAPRLLLLDEPLHSVDVHLRDELALLIRSIADERRLGLVVVTHDRRDAFALATEIVVLHAGRVVESGPATRLAQEPQTAFAAAFLAGATCIPLPAAKDGRVVTPFGELAAPRSGDGLVLALLPGDLRIAAPGEGTAVGRVLRVVPDPLGLLATVQVGPHVVQAACGREVVRRGDRVELALNHAPRVLLRDALAHDRSGPR